MELTGLTMTEVNKVVLAYSGGLDTSVIVRWLQETYQCQVVTFTADIGQGEEVEPARAKAEALGVDLVFATGDGTVQVSRDVLGVVVDGMVLAALDAAPYEGEVRVSIGGSGGQWVTVEHTSDAHSPRAQLQPTTVVLAAHIGLIVHVDEGRLELVVPPMAPRSSGCSGTTRTCPGTQPSSGTPVVSTAE